MWVSVFFPTRLGGVVVGVRAVLVRGIVMLAAATP
jgi:hypothetical protein